MTEGDALRRELTALLRELGADRVGFADLRGQSGAALPVGVSALVALPPEIVRPLTEHPTRAYYDTYNRVNERLEKMAYAAAELLQRRGFRAVANTEANLSTAVDDRSPLPHKTVACLAGLGWVGKNDLLTTAAYGGAVRLCTVVTDAPLPTDEPILFSRCGDCALCVETCPAGALYGTLWQAGTDRDQMFDRLTCERVQKARTGRYIGIPIAICGRCFAVCPYTRAWLDRAEKPETN